MEILRKRIHGSPYVGVFSIVTEQLALFSYDANAKELEGIKDALDVELLQCKIAGSGLLGVFSTGIGKKILVPEIAEDSEIKNLENLGMKVKKLSGYTAIGNLVAMNQNAVLVSRSVDRKTRDEIGKFLNIEVFENPVKEFDLPGSFMRVTDMGFIAHPDIQEREFKALEKIFRVNGSATTANFGDSFVGNCVVANSHAAIVGGNTSGYELLRIDEGLRGD
jgi:translation initiation factor 6